MVEFFRSLGVLLLILDPAAEFSIRMIGSPAKISLLEPIGERKGKDGHESIRCNILPGFIYIYKGGEEKRKEKKSSPTKYQ
jgi:hypothetical protein